MRCVCCSIAALFLKSVRPAERIISVLGLRRAAPHLAGEMLGSMYPAMDGISPLTLSRNWLLASFCKFHVDGFQPRCRLGIDWILAPYSAPEDILLVGRAPLVDVEQMDFLSCRRFQSVRDRFNLPCGVTAVENLSENSVKIR